MIQPDNPNIWQKNGITIENLVPRGGGLRWNEETQTWDKSFEEKTFTDPDTGLTYIWSEPEQRWMRLAGKPGVPKDIFYAMKNQYAKKV